MSKNLDDALAALAGHDGQHSEESTQYRDVAPTIAQDRCWREGASPVNEIGLCEPCAAWLRGDTEADPAEGHDVFAHEPIGEFVDRILRLSGVPRTPRGSIVFFRPDSFSPFEGPVQFRYIRPAGYEGPVEQLPGTTHPFILDIAEAQERAERALTAAIQSILPAILPDVDPTVFVVGRYPLHDEREIRGAHFSQEWVDEVRAPDDGITWWPWLGPA